MKKTKVIKAVKIIAVILAVLIAIPLLTFTVIRGVYVPILRSSNKITALSGIDRMETVEIGGIKQALYFRGQNTENPVILFLHGGPGFPMMPFIHTYQYDLEYDFTIVNWDQRNVGKTYYANDPDVVRETVNAERVIKDAHEVTQYIKEKLDKEQIIIMGHSWGSVLGTMLVQTYPQDYMAYIGVGQVANMTDNERVGYEKVLEAARAAGNQKDIAALEAFAPYPPPGVYSEDFNEIINELRKYQAKYDLATGVSFEMIWAILTSPYYSLSDMMYVFVDISRGQGDIMRFLMDDYEARDFGLEYQMPVFYIMGVNDWQTPYSVAKELFTEISAPDMEFFSIPDAGHSPMFENRAEFSRVLLEEILPRIHSVSGDSE